MEYLQGVQYLFLDKETAGMTGSCPGKGIMRINNYISSSGLCSRRAADELIEQGKVKLNGRTAQLGDTVEEGDQVEVNGRAVKPKKKKVYIALNKPPGIVCTAEKNVKNNIVDYVGHEERIFPIGRLDKNSEGLILLTNDGDIVNRILRAEHGHEKEYVVSVNKPIDSDFLHQMRRGVWIFNPVKEKYTKTLPCTVEKVNDYTFRIILSQGLNRQIRRMCEALDYKVTKLRRVRIMHIRLKGIAPGRWRNLTKEEVDKIKGSK